MPWCIVITALVVFLPRTSRGVVSMLIMNRAWMNGYGMMQAPTMMGVTPANILLMSLGYTPFIALLGLAAVWLLRMLNTPSPLDSLQTRYAKGEISKEQFDA